MVILTGMKGTMNADDAMPPRSIFDPPDEADEEELSDGWGNDHGTVESASIADTLTTRDTRYTHETMSTAMTGPPGRRRLRGKHPASLNEVELRIQLWDSYRLARIILGTPIRSFSLRGKTILHSIRKVAEMKLELIRLEKELEMAKVLAQNPRHFHSSYSSDTLPATTSKKESRASRDPVISPTCPDDEEAGLPTPVRRTKPISLKQRLEIYKIKYERLQSTHEKTMKEVQVQLDELRRRLKSTENTKRVIEAAPGSSRHLFEPSKKEAAKSNTKERGLLKHWTKLRCQKKQKNKANDTLEAVATVARDYDYRQQSPEELHLRTILARPSNAVREKKPKPEDEHKQLLELIENLKKIVAESSEGAKIQLGAVEEQFRSNSFMTEDDSKSQSDLPRDAADESQIIQTKEEFDQRLQTAKILHRLELETAKSKHIQQVVDLSGQLDAYQHQVDRQNEELQKWRKKYNYLEEMTVTPSEVKEVLRDIESLSPQDTLSDDHAHVQAKVVRVLQRMLQLQSRQETEQQIMQKTRKLALAGDAESEEQLEDLKMQHQLLLEDTSVPPEEWRKQIGHQRRSFEKEVKLLSKRQEKRMREIEMLETRLTELAFVAVEIEDLEQEFHEAKGMNEDELAKARQHINTTSPKIRLLQNQTKQVMASQRMALRQLETSWLKCNKTEGLQNRLNELTNIDESEEATLLAIREEELRQAREELRISQQRVRELEERIKSNKVGSRQTAEEKSSHAAMQLALD